MTENTFGSIAREYLNEEIEVITVQGNFDGRLLTVNGDTIILENRLRGRISKIIIRIEAIVALYRIETMPRGFFDFPMENEHNQQVNESSSHENH